jgi:pimeloyl-ACP methyl ester carboxylesterase
MKNIILLHGALGNHNDFDMLVPHLKDLSVHSFDFSGHDGKPIDKPFTIQQFSQDLQEYISDHSLKEPYIFGYSMGGYVALYFAANNPDIIRGIITLGTKLNWNPETAIKETSLLKPDKIEADFPQFANTLIAKFTPDNWKQVVLHTSSLLVQLGLSNFLNEQTAQKIKGKVDVILGEFDKMVTAEESKDFVSHLEKGSFHIMPNTKHPLDKVDMIQLAELINKLMGES